MKVTVLGSIVLLLGAASQCRPADMLSTWRNDIKHQVVGNRPEIEARYTDATRTGFEIDADKYRLTVDLKAATGQRVRGLTVRSPAGAVDVLRGRGIYLRLTDAGGKVYSSLNSKEASRVNIYRRGPYYIETHWLDVGLVDAEGATAPVKCEVVFYSYPEKTHVGVVLHVMEAMEVKAVDVACDFEAETCANAERSKATRVNSFWVIKRAANAPSCALIYPVRGGMDHVTAEKIEDGVRVRNYLYSDRAHEGEVAKWNAGDKRAAYFEILPLPSSEVSAELEAEVQPLLSTSMVAASGRALGYDPIRGCYKVQTDNPGGFSYHYYDDQNAYETASLWVQNDNTARKIYVMHETRNNPGIVECGVVQDENGDTLPITVQISKNFGGEKEEPFYNPNDTQFSETFFPVYLASGERRSLTSLHLYQNWGVHPLKQFSSLGAWMDYYHMSTGVTETTCYVPFKFAGLDGVSIADLRPMSQRMWESQPQHDNVAGHSFLRYRDDKGAWHFLEYTGTTFRSTGPNWADMSMSYLSDDGGARVTIDVFELPQTEELRNFIHMRVDFLRDIDVKDGDLARNVRLLNIASWVQRLRYTHVAYGGPTSEATIVPIKLNDGFTIEGAPLAAKNGFAAVYPDTRGANAYVVRRFEGTIGGKAAGCGVSLFGEKNGDTILMLVPVTNAKSIEAGDYLDIDLFIMPYGGGTQDHKPAQKAALDYGVNAPKVTSVAAGRKISDFPTRIALDESGRAEFSVTGGINHIPIIVEGAEDYWSLRLHNADGERALVAHSREGEKDGYQVFARDDGTFGFVFLVKTDGGEHRYVASRRTSRD